MIRRHGPALALAVLWALSSCGGGDPPARAPAAASTGGRAEVATAVRALASLRKARPLQQGAWNETATSVDPGEIVDPVDAANQLFNYAEAAYPELFPGHPATGFLLGYLYRHYEATGIYVGVSNDQVYVLGGAFGTEIRKVGALRDFIVPEARILSLLCDTRTRPFEAFARPRAEVHKNAALTIAGCAGPIARPRWRQTGGPAVALAADRTQTISFDPPAAGSYLFQAEFTDHLGTAHSVPLAIDVAPAAVASARVTVRASHSVRMGGKVSVRAWPALPEGDSVKAVTWTQIEGPAVELDLRTSRLALFTAPEVSRDTLIRLRATLHTTLGHTASDEVMVLVEHHPQARASDRNAVWASDHVSRTYAYVANGPYAGALQACMYDSASSYERLCTLDQVPFIAQEPGEIPSVEQVMNHVVVSHDWLGRNFEAFLRQHDHQGDFRRMLRSVTAIVLSAGIRPSFYYGGTGAIYLDGDEFWMTPEERDIVNEAPDYRSDFGNGLKFETLWRYTRDNKSIFPFYDPRQRVTRTLAEVADQAGWLLFHELGHALDYLPPSAYRDLAGNRSAWANIAPRYTAGAFTSDIIPQAYPLTSQPMKRLGQVMFRGVTATAAELAYTPDQVAAFFGPDLATDDYAYTTSFEDVAMTVEEVLMQRRLGIRRDFAISDVRVGDATSSSVIVRWGQRGRVGEAAIRPRAKAVVHDLVPWLDPAEVDLLPPPQQMRAGATWSENLTQPATLARRARPLSAAEAVVERWRLEQELQRMRRHRHGGGPRLPPAGVR